MSVRKLRLAFLAELVLLIVFLSSVAPLQAVSASVVWPTSADAVNHSGRWPTIAEIQCDAYIVMDRNSGAVLLEKQPDKPLYPASTTKVLTSLIALEKLDLNEIVTVSSTAIRMPSGSSKVGYRAGEQVAVKDMLAGMMLASGNDAANALGEKVSGSQDLFATQMNERARLAGATHSNFMNPSGTHHELHVTTARDLALITSAAMKNPLFRELVSLKSASMPATNLHPFNGWLVLVNTNRLMVFDSSYFASDLLKEISGVKTGSTNMAGECLIATATTTSGAELVGILLKAPLNIADTNKFVYMRTLFEEGARRAAPQSSAIIAETTVPTAKSPTVNGTIIPTTLQSMQTAGLPTVTANQSNNQLSVSSSSVSAAAVFLEEVRLRFGIDQTTLLFVTILTGLLSGILIGLILIWTLFRATHKQRGRNGQNGQNSQIKDQPSKRN